MSPFSDNKPLTITQIDDNIWRLDKDLAYNYIDKHGEIIDIINVPKGYLSDGSSIPFFAWNLVGHPLQGANAAAGFVHDWMYSLVDEKGKHIYPQKYCDKVYLKICKELGNNFMSRRIKHLVLRTFGRIYYKKKNGKITIDLI